MMFAQRPRPMFQLKTRFAAALLALSAATAAHASSFSVTPVRIYMKPTDRAVAVTLTNEGDQPVALQAELVVWSQKPDGTDELTPTEDLALSPPILKLAPKSRQVVRLALIKKFEGDRQLTYRLIVRDVPEVTAPKDPSVAIPITLALSMPIFITPANAARSVTCAWQAAGAKPAVSCANSGLAYAQIREAVLTRNGETLARFEGGAYVLPGARKTLELAGATAPAAGDASLRLVFDDAKEQTISVRVP
jgi:fimbrial chaperone protein